MKIFNLVILLFFYTISLAQSTNPEVIALSGECFAGTNTQLSWTIGEVMSETYSNSGNQLTQGFNQTNLIVSSIENLFRYELNIQLNIF